MVEATTDSEQVVTEYVRLINEREFSDVSDVLAESFTMTGPMTGTVEGRETVTEHFQGLLAGFSDFHITVHEVLSGGNLVMSESTLSGTHDGEFDGIPPTQQEFEIPEMARFIVEDGQIQDERTYYDQHELLGQLGLLDE